MSSVYISPHSYTYDVSEEEETQVFSLLSKRKRSSRACDQCRNTKSRCQRAENGSLSPCANCFKSGLECTFLGPNRKRGPPKGYIVDLEHQVYRLKALMGIILSSTHPGVRLLIKGLSEDHLAREIITEVENGPFGPSGRLRDNTLHDPYTSGQNSFVSSRNRREQRVFAGYDELDPSLPSYQWQNRLIMELNSRLQSNLKPELPVRDAQNRIIKLENEFSYSFTPERYDSPQAAGLALPPVVNPLPNLGLHSLASKRPDEAATIWMGLYNNSPPSSSKESQSTKESGYESDDPADAVGQLSLNEKEEVGFLGKTSGMHLLAKPRRTDNLRNGGIWHLPQSRYWPVSERGGPMVEEDLRLNIQLPPEHIQNNLLSLYWAYVQPILPIIDKEKFLEQYQPNGFHKIPRLLLLAMFTIATRYTNYYPPPSKGTMWVAGCDILDQAKYILNWVYDSPRPSTCQALVLLAYREFGVGAISQAWLYMGMAIRMATDLGMHRSSDRWQLSGETLFSEVETSLRKRMWHCCVLLDRIMAFVMGRPMCIRERDYDTPLPDLNSNEESELWFPQKMDDSLHKQRLCYSLSTLHATSSLASLLALVVDTIYACRSGMSFSARHVESFKISAHLQTWYDQLPRHLKYFEGEDPVPSPHVLTLHMMYWCVMLLAHRPFIRLHTSKDNTDGELAHMSKKSLVHSQNAASRISDLVAIYRRSWDLSYANAYLGWLILSSGIMHVATLAMKLENQWEAREGLQHCLDALEDMKVVWPSSERALQLLRGTEVDAGTTNKGFPDVSNIYDWQYPHKDQPNPYLNTESNTVQNPPAMPTQPPDFASFFASMNPEAPVPEELLYFPGYEHWPPESLVFQSVPRYDYDNRNSGTM